MSDIQDSIPDESCDEESEICSTGLVTFDLDALRQATKDADEPKKYVHTCNPYNMSFKMVKSDSRLVKSLLFSYGFIQCSPKNSNFNLCWSNTHLNPHVMRSLKSWQRVNHFPRSYLITKKDQLHIQLNRYRAHYGSAFDFIPESYCTPMGDDKRERLRKMLSSSSSYKGALFISKPANSSRGRGITFITKPEQINEIQDTDSVVLSRYISNPYLIQNKKSDLRIYVAVTSFYPLIAYTFTDGLTRFAVDDYSDDVSGTSAQAQLTNYSLHKTNEKFIKNNRVDCESIGNKWTLGAMLRHMEKEGVDVKLLMLRIEDIVIKTLLSVQRVVGASCRKLNLHPNTCFELFGFDVLVDDNLKPWLLEVNLSPSLNCDAPVDSIIKSDLLSTTLNLACIPMVTEKNIYNKAYILSRLSPSVDELSNAVLTTSVTNSIPDKEQSASTSPSTVDSGYDGRSVTSDLTLNAPDRRIYSRISPSRKRLTIKTAKQKRAQQQLKITYSSEKILEQFKARLESLTEKIKEEERRMGNFVRIFPRPESRAIYGHIFEDSGPEQWDAKLSDSLFGDSIQTTQRDYEMFHAQMIQYKTTKSLAGSTRDMLKSAFETADKYVQPFYENDADPYPKSLPKLRFGLRKRTLSQIDFDFKRKAEVIAKRECGLINEDLGDLKQFLYEQYKAEGGTPRLV